ncbi:MAG: hypothetical protein WDO73_24725 [Ignavibacteriota bacterium]
MDRGRRTIFTPNEVILELHGEAVGRLSNPRRSFQGQSFDTPWSDLQVAYFSSYALWNY